MVKAYFNNTLIAATDHPVELEGNQYFPENDVKMEYLKPSDYHTVCPWKGKASYYDVTVAGETDRDAAWYYPEPSPDASSIKGHIAFWSKVKIAKE